MVLETRHGLLVEALLDAGFTVIPVNPDVVARRRGPARKKDDAEDARICCLLALDRHAALKTLIPHGELGGELRAIGRDDERAARDQRRLLNRLRADLQTTYPAALALAGTDLGAPTMLRLLERWPTQPELAASLARGAGRVRPRRPPRLARALRRPGHHRAGRAVAAHPRLPRAGQGRRDPAGRGPAAGPARGPPRLGSQRMAELLLGGRRTGRDHTVKDPDPGKAFPGGEIYLSMPGLGDLLAARVAGEIGEHITQFDIPDRSAVLRRDRPGHPPIRQERFRRRPPAGAQPLPRRRGASMGVLQPAAQRLGARVLRPENRRREDRITPPCGP